MLGPLPTLYRVIVCMCAFLVFGGLGVWTARLMPGSTVASVLTGLGAGLGIVVVLLLLHDPRDRDHRTRARVRAPRA